MIAAVWAAAFTPGMCPEHTAVKARSYSHLVCSSDPNGFDFNHHVDGFIVFGQ